MRNNTLLFAIWIILLTICFIINIHANDMKGKLNTLIINQEQIILLLSKDYPEIDLSNKIKKPRLKLEK